VPYGSLHFLHPLHTPQARKQALEACPTSRHPPSSLKGWKDAAAASAKAMWVGFHWQPGNTFLSQSARECPTTRAAFAAATRTWDFEVPLGGWTWTEEEPMPGFHILCKAKVWVEAKFQGVRDMVCSEPMQFQVTRQPDSEITTLRLTRGPLVS